MAESGGSQLVLRDSAPTLLHDAEAYTVALRACVILVRFGTSRNPLFFFFKDPAPPDISPLPLPDALPISIRFPARPRGAAPVRGRDSPARRRRQAPGELFLRLQPPAPDPPPAVDRRPGAGHRRRQRRWEIGRAHV